MQMLPRRQKATEQERHSRCESPVVRGWPTYGAILGE